MTPSSKTLPFLSFAILAWALAVTQASAGRLVALDPPRSTQVYPGLLETSLLGRGSFAFGTQQVQFEKLRVLGNVYVGRINGKPLRESYLFRSTINKRSDPELAPGSPAEQEELRLEII